MQNIPKSWKNLEKIQKMQNIPKSWKNPENQKGIPRNFLKIVEKAEKIKVANQFHVGYVTVTCSYVTCHQVWINFATWSHFSHIFFANLLGWCIRKMNSLSHNTGCGSINLDFCFSRWIIESCLIDLIKVNLDIYVGLTCGNIYQSILAADMRGMSQSLLRNPLNNLKWHQLDSVENLESFRAQIEEIGAESARYWIKLKRIKLQLWSRTCSFGTQKRLKDFDSMKFHRRWNCVSDSDTTASKIKFDIWQRCHSSKVKLV